MPTPPSPFAETPQPPYYVVTFSSIRTAGDQGYEAMADRMAELALQQPGCLGAESARMRMASASPIPIGPTRKA